MNGNRSQGSSHGFPGAWCSTRRDSKASTSFKGQIEELKPIKVT